MVDEMTDEELLTFDEALQTLGTSRPTLYRLLSQGDIKGLKVGKQWRFRRVDLQAYMERGPVEISAAPEADIDRELSEFESELAQDADATVVDKALDLARRIIEAAIDKRASDIHMEPAYIDGVMCWWLRYRIDGVLQEIRRMPISLQDMLTAQFKTMADMNVGEKRLPQDGRIRLSRSGKEFDIRVAIGITQFGEGFVMRVLDQSNIFVGLDLYGPSGDALARLRELIRRPNGMILFTGPTGSGKTATAYSCLNEIADPRVKILTIEDPVEYRFPYVTSCSVNPRLGLTFPTALRSFLRQDPDIIFVGETRDLETIAIALEATLTGHLVLAPFPTNDAPSTIIRLMDMGVEPYLIAAGVIGIVSQRLCRKICNQCRETYEADASVLERFGWESSLGAERKEGTLSHSGAEPGTSGQTITLSRGTGCEHCRGRGYKGRVGLFEVMSITPEINDMIVRRAPVSEIRTAAKAAGMREMREDGLDKVLAGITTPHEVMRVIYTA